MQCETDVLFAWCYDVFYFIDRFPVWNTRWHLAKYVWFLDVIYDVIRITSDDRVIGQATFKGTQAIFSYTQAILYSNHFFQLTNNSSHFSNQRHYFN